MSNKSEIASRTAKGGFDNEKEVSEKFTNWRNDKDAQQWLKIMMYDLKDIISVDGIEFGSRGYKADVLVTVIVKIKRQSGNKEITSLEKIQVKLVSNKTGSNQIERKYVDTYKDLWHMPDNVANILKHFCGELPPRENGSDSRRMYMNEFTHSERESLRHFLESNMVMIISDIIRGRGRFAAEWMLVVHKHQGYRWKLVSINEAINHYVGDHKVEYTHQGGIRLGGVTMQRKGGDNGERTANQLQFKANPLSIFDLP